MIGRAARCCRAGARGHVSGPAGRRSTSAKPGWFACAMPERAALDHQRLRMAVERGDDDLLDGVVDRARPLDHLLQPRRRAGRRCRRRAARRGRCRPAPSRSCRRGSPAACRSSPSSSPRRAPRRRCRARAARRPGSAASCCGPCDLVVVGLDRVVHHLLDRVRRRACPTRRRPAQRVGDQVDQRLCSASSRGYSAKIARGLRVLDMRLERDRAFGAQHLHQLARPGR